MLRVVPALPGHVPNQLTCKGLEQARMAGARLAELVGSGRIFVAVSPFERAIQTLYGLFAGGFPRKQVGSAADHRRVMRTALGCCGRA